MYQQPIAGLTPLALCCPIGAAPIENVDLIVSMWCCVPFCPMLYHKSIGRATLAMRWRARRAASSRRRGIGRSRRVAAACRRSGRNARRAGPGVARFVNLANLARQSRRPPSVACFFHLSSKGMWLVACIRGDMRDPVLSVVFYSLCGQAIMAAAVRRLWRRRSRAGSWEVCFLQISQGSR